MVISVEDKRRRGDLVLELRLDLEMSLVLLVVVVHVVQRLEDATGHEGVALAAVVFVGGVGLCELDVLLSVLDK